MKSIIIKLMALVMLWSCGDGKTQTRDTGNPAPQGTLVITGEQFSKNNMKVEALQKMSIGSKVTASGTIDVPPENKAVVSAYHAGYIKASPLLVGNEVAIGQLLVLLENPEYVTLQQDYLEVAGRMDFLRAEYERQKVMVEEQISSRKNFLEAEGNYKSALASYNGLRKNLELLHIDPAAAEVGNITATAPVLSPIKGRISKVFISRGMYVSPADPILEIIDNDHIHLELAVYEKDILKVKVGQSISFRIPEVSKEVFKGEVHLVGSFLDPSNRSIKVHGHLDEGAPENLAIGMFVEAEIETSVQEYHVLPEEAIVTEGTEARAYLLEREEVGNYIFKKVPVKTAAPSEGFVGILNYSDFPPGSKFLTSGTQSLPAGN